MQWIDEATVEAAWQEMNSLGIDQAANEMTELGQNQPELLAFVMAMGEDLNDGAKELGIYLFFVVYRIFSRGHEGQVPRISSDQIMQQHEETEKLLEDLQGKDEMTFESVAMDESSRQSWILKYLVEALLEAPQSEDPVELSEEEFGELFLILKTVVDTLDIATDES